MLRYLLSVATAPSSDPRPSQRPDPVPRCRRRAGTQGQGSCPHRRACRDTAIVEPPARIRDACSDRSRTTGIAGFGPGRVRTLARRGRRSRCRCVSRPDRRDPAGMRIQPAEKSLLPWHCRSRPRRRARSRCSGASAGRRGPQTAGRDHRHRAVDRKYLPADGARPPGCLAGGRPRTGGSRATRSNVSRCGPGQKNSRRSARRGGPGARSRLACCGKATSTARTGRPASARSSSNGAWNRLRSDLGPETALDAPPPCLPYAAAPGPT